MASPNKTRDLFVQPRKKGLKTPCNSMVQKNKSQEKMLQERLSQITLTSDSKPKPEEKGLKTPKNSMAMMKPIEEDEIRFEDDDDIPFMDDDDIPFMDDCVEHEPKMENEN